MRRGGSVEGRRGMRGREVVPRDGSGAVSPVVGVQRVKEEGTATVRFEGIGGG